MSSYYNTTRSFGEELVLYESKASSQERVIIAWMQSRHIARGWTPEEIRDVVFKRRIPITSVRRAITNLTNAGMLEKTSVQRKGDYGRPCHVWMLKSPAQPIQRQLL